ncbi:MAG: hypothetical protein WD929_05730 [Steroidobacteraceae bacterium]
MKTPWLSRPGSIRTLWRVFVAVLALTVAAQLVVHVHGYFRVDGWFAFSAIYGFLACVAMVLFAKLLGLVLKRRDSYYEEPDDDHV